MNEQTIRAVDHMGFHWRQLLIGRDSLLSRGVFAVLKIVLVLMVCLSCGLGSSLVQLVAWAGMFTEEIEQTNSVTQALENTFDGEHKCSMCEIAAGIREAEQSLSVKGNQNDSNRSGKLELTFKPVLLFTKSFQLVRLEPDMLGFCGETICAVLCSRYDEVVTPPPQAV